MIAPAVARPHDRLGELEVPVSLQAAAPPETRGTPRDAVRLMVSEAMRIRNLKFHDIQSVLRPGDLLVVNNSATLPASVVVDQDLVIHFSTELPGGLWVLEPRRLAGSTSLPHESPQPGPITLPGGGMAELLTPYPIDTPTRRLWAAHLDLGRPVVDYLTTWGRPIRYRHTSGPYPLAAYQTVFATVPGSAEMPSAGRPFTDRLATSLISHGVSIAALTLHAGVSSLESGEEPFPERFDVPDSTAALVNHTRRQGGRVIAVGTTVVRALESTADSRRRSHPARSWTDLVIGADHRMRLVDGLITGWHEPESSHLRLLEALGGRDLLTRSYQMALDTGYLWHEFGDSQLILAY